MKPTDLCEKHIKDTTIDTTIDLNLLQKHMKSVKFYGQTTILWQDGEIVVIREEKVLKPQEFNYVYDKE